MSDTTDNDEALEERAEKALENVMRLRSERDDLAHRVAELERELRARRAVDGWLADAGIETRSLERHGDWLKVYEWKTANEGTRCFEVAEAETYEVLADALGLDWRK